MWKFGLILILTGISMATRPVTADDVKAIELQPLDHEQWMQKRQAYRGNILVVDMWATWCSSCIERFPRMVSLHQTYAAQGVQFVSMNLDDRGDTRALEQAEHFLNSVHARFPNYHMNENLMVAFEKLDLIGIPVVIIYDRQGRQRFRLTGDNPYHQFTDADIERAVKQLLDE